MPPQAEGNFVIAAVLLLLGVAIWRCLAISICRWFDGQLDELRRELGIERR